MDVATFRQDFPEFADVAKYPDPQVQFYIDLSTKLMSECRFGDIYPYAQELFVAHNLTLAAGNQQAAAGGGLPGQGGGGAVASKKVGSVSVNYDTADSMLPGAGHWNMTTYGRQYIQLVRLIGAVAYQL